MATADMPAGADDPAVSPGWAALFPAPASWCIPAARSFALVGCGRVSDGELVDEDEWVVDAHGMALPDGRAVTYCGDPHGCGDPELRIWSSVRDAAHYWGSWVFWTTPPPAIPAFTFSDR